MQQMQQKIGGAMQQVQERDDGNNISTPPVLQRWALPRAPGYCPNWRIGPMDFADFPGV